MGFNRGVLWGLVAAFILLASGRFWDFVNALMAQDYYEKSEKARPPSFLNSGYLFIFTTYSPFLPPVPDSCHDQPNHPVLMGLKFRIPFGIVLADRGGAVREDPCYFLDGPTVSRNFAREERRRASLRMVDLASNRSIMALRGVGPSLGQRDCQRTPRRNWQ